MKPSQSDKLYSFAMGKPVRALRTSPPSTSCGAHAWYPRRAMRASLQAPSMSDDQRKFFRQMRAERLDLWRHLCSRRGLARQIVLWASATLDVTDASDLPEQMHAADVDGSLQRTVCDRVFGPDSPRGPGRGWETFLAEAKRLARALKRTRSARIKANTGLAFSFANNYRNREDHEDIVQCAHVGLIIAIDRFDPDRGHHLSTYAYHWMRACTQQGIRQSYAIQLGERDLRAYFRLGSAYKDLCLTEGQSTYDTLSDATGIGVEKIHQLLSAPIRKSGLDADDIAEDATPEDALLLKEVFLEVNRQVDSLPEFEREAVKHKHAFNGHALRKFSEIGEDYGVCRETARKRYIRSLQKIRSGIELRGLAPV